MKDEDKTKEQLIKDLAGIRVRLAELEEILSRNRDVLKRCELLSKHSREIILFISPEGRILDANETACTAYGYDRESLVSLNIKDLLPPDIRHLSNDQMTQAFEGEVLFEAEHMRKDGSVFPVEVSSSVAQIGEDHVLVSVIHDITDRKHAENERGKLEALLLRAQKLEAVGTLAGGAAHNLNNILGIIVGHTELAKLDSVENASSDRHLREILNACSRAKDLIRQILSFSHTGDTLERQLWDLRPIIEEVAKFLKASLPSTIEIHQSISSEKGLVFADSTQVYQVLTNLCTNAAQAMEEAGGILEISLTDIDLDAANMPPQLDIKPSPYVRLTVADTGHGMDSATLERVFDPYFTTKEAGKGSGLGLAVVRSIVKRHGGAISVSSQEGKGTTFHVYLPRIERESTTPGEPSSPIPGGKERILFVDDEVPLVEVWEKALERLGYKVVTKTSCLEALELFRVHPDYFDLVITDYTMPHMTGVDLAKNMIHIRPDIPIILCTGWRERISDEKTRKAGVCAFMTKPLELRRLAEVIRKVLDEKYKHNSLLN